MPVHVSRSGGRRGDLRKVARWGRAVLREAGCGAHELSVVLADDPFIRQLNGEWRSKDSATDVLSFPQDGPEGPLLGDIVISVDTATRQAAEHGHDLDSELRVLLVHGICHLLGHDHHEPEQTARMRRVEDRLLAVLGVERDGLVGRASPR